MQNKSVKNSIATNSAFLIFVRLITLLVGIIQTMILSRKLTLEQYGTYSQALLVISMSTMLLGLGMSNAVNYFYNINDDENEKKLYVNSIFGISLISGIIGAIIILINSNNIVKYFDNHLLKGIIIYICLRPLLNSLITIYQQLYISCGMVKIIALRNFIISILQVCTITIICNITTSLFIVFKVLLILDLVQVISFHIYFKRNRFLIYPRKIQVKYIKKILIYAAPLALAIMMGTILKDMDKLFIGKIMSTEKLGLYTNVSKELPFEFIASSFTAVITPIIIRLNSANNCIRLKEVWSDYIELGYTTTWILCSAAIVCAPQLLVFLYSEKYIEGTSVFIIYIFVELFRFTYFGMILSAKGKTKVILLYSFITMSLNFILNIILINTIGFVGPAIASLLSIAIVNIAQLVHSSKLVSVEFLKLIKIEKMVSLILKITIVSILMISFKEILLTKLNSNIIILIIVYPLTVIILIILNFNRIRTLIKSLNSY